MVKVSFNRYVSRRIEIVRKQIEAETQKTREKTIKNLEEIFNAAAKIARGKIEHQRINGKMVPITLRQRRMCVRVAEHVAKTMNSIASNFDEREIVAQLDDLERLVNEASTRTKKGNPEKERRKARTNEKRNGARDWHPAKTKIG